MGRRKQANPTRLTDENTLEDQASTSSNQQKDETLKNGKPSDKKSSNSNFSISAHLQANDAAKSTTKNRKSSNNNQNVSYEAAQKAYQTLMSNLKQQEAMMKSLGFANNNAAAAFFMNPFFGAQMPSFDFFSNAFQSSAPKKKHKLGNNLDFQSFRFTNNFVWKGRQFKRLLLGANLKKHLRYNMRIGFV